MKNKNFLSDLILIAATIGVTYLLIALDPSGNLFESIMSTAVILVLFVFVILLIVGGSTLLLLMFQGFRTRRADAAWRTNPERPNFFEEMKSVLQTRLIPLGFYESKVSTERIPTVEYTKGDFSVKLSWDILNSHYYFSARASKEKGSYLTDIYIDGHILKADKFKRDSLAKLNGWLSRNGVN